MSLTLGWTIREHTPTLTAALSVAEGKGGHFHSLAGGGEGQGEEARRHWRELCSWPLHWTPAATLEVAN